MKISTPEISWHGKEPIYSVDFQFIKGDIRRLATCGTDRHIRMWEVKLSTDSKTEVEFLSTLTRHTKTVNVVRFSPDGEVLASAGDDSVVMLWQRNDSPSGASLFAEDDEENKETWSVFKVLRSHLEDVYDINWSPDSKYLISGSVDNSAILWDVKKGSRLGLFPDHRSFVQGVAFDPKGEYLATMSCDRCCRIFSIQTKNCLHTISKMVLPSSNSSVPVNNGVTEKEKEKPKQTRIFHDDTMRSFFRRLSFSPDGQLLIVPAGCIEKGSSTDLINTTFIFTRANISKPALHLPGPHKAAIAVRCCPVLFDLRKILKNGHSAKAEEEKENIKNEEDECNEWKKYHNLFCLPYRMVFAVATEDAVLFYDTQQPRPFALISNIHYHTLSDLTWSYDGRILVVSSTDGYCTLISFGETELGTHYKDQVVHAQTCEDLKRKEEERRQLKMKRKEKRKSQVVKETKDEKIDAAKSAVEGGDKVAVPSEPSNTSPRRVALSSVDSPKSSARRVALQPVGDLAANKKSSSETQTDNKSPRRVALLSMDGTESKPRPRRIEVTSLLSSQKTCESSDSQSQESIGSSVESKESGITEIVTSEESSLHLELEATCDVDMIAEVKSKSENSEVAVEKCPSPCKQQNPAVKTLLSHVSPSPSSGCRRVPLTTLYTPPKTNKDKT